MTSVAVANEIEVNEQKDECGELFGKPSAKNLENRASISSVDSSISLSYDAVPFTPRGSITVSSSTDDESRADNRCSGTDSSSSDAAAATKKIRTDTENEEPFEPPNDELVKRIVDQVEYYFSDENIVKDAFLLKHVRRNKEGYVSLKLIASFKRVKHIARDWRVVRVALERSTKLEINESGTKLRRRDPLPLYDQTTPSRTVVAVNIPPEKATIENVAELFRNCGEIALIRILRPGNPIPADVRPFYNKHPEMHDTVSALIEFVRTESAHNALNRDSEDQSSIHVVELNAPPNKKKIQVKKYTSNNSKAFDSEFSSSCQSGSETEDRFRLRLHQRRCSSPHMQTPPLPPEQLYQRRWSRDSGSESTGSSFSRSRSNSGAGPGAGTVYFVPDQRRLSAGWDSSSDSYSSCRSRSNSGASMPEVFQMRRYSLPRKEPSCCCCGFPKCETLTNGAGARRYSVGRSSDDGYGARPLSRCASGESSDGPYRRESIPEFYPLHRNSNGSFTERRPSLTKATADGQWSRSSSLSSNADAVRRLSDSDGRLGLTRQRSFGNGITGLPGSADVVVRLPRGPDGGRGFQRELIEYALPE